jgi:hypothetical protein
MRLFPRPQRPRFQSTFLPDLVVFSNFFANMVNVCDLHVTIQPHYYNNMHESKLFPILSRGWNPSMCALPGLGDTRSPLE